jgi:hypothetical protein
LTRFLKFTLSFAIAVVIGLGSAYSVLWIEAKSGTVDLTSPNPYARAAYAARDILPVSQP